MVANSVSDPAMESPKRSVKDHRLRCFGWTPERAQEFTELARPESFPGRVLRQQHGRFQLVCPGGEMEAGVRGKLRRRGTYPVVGDWVAVSPDMDEKGIIEEVLIRSSLILRKVPGRRSREQAIAANIRHHLRHDVAEPGLQPETSGALSDPGLGQRSPSCDRSEQKRTCARTLLGR